MNVDRIIDLVSNNLIIAAVSSKDDVEAAVESPCEVVFLLNATILNAGSLVEMVHSAKKIAFIHVDLMKGLANDLDGLKYLKEVIQPDGVISTKGIVVKRAKELGFVTVQRLFVLDSKSIDMGIKQLKDMKPDFVEIMPGSMAKIISRVSERVTTPVIAGGLIDQEEEVMSLIKAGAISISTSAKALWRI